MDISYHNSSISFSIKNCNISDAKELISLLMEKKLAEPIKIEEPIVVEEKVVVEPIAKEPIKIEEPLVVEPIKIEEPSILQPDIVPEEIYENVSEVSEDETKSVSSEPNRLVDASYVDFPEFKTKQEFCEKILSNFFTEKSYKNYWPFWNNPVLDSMRNRNLNEVVALLEQEIKKNENKSYRNIYNFFTLIFKINKQYRIFDDINKISTLFEPVKALKVQQSTVRNIEKKTT